MNLTKARYATRPEILQSRGDGSFLFNYEIETEAIPSMTGDPDREGFICSQVVIFGNPDKRAVKKAVIEAEFSNEDEKKLINDWNAFNAGVLQDEKYKINYLVFLERRRVIKEIVDNEPLIL